MNHNEAENYLIHYGKKGMKWGQRRQVAREKAFEKSANRGNKLIEKRKLTGLTEIKKGPNKGSNYYTPSDPKLVKKQLANSLAFFGALGVSAMMTNRAHAAGLAASAGLLAIANDVRMERNNKDISNAFRRDYGF